MMEPSVGATMIALCMTKPSPNEPPILQLQERSVPPVPPGHHLVKVRAAAINPSDVLNTKGGFPYTTFPRVPGRDFAGTVVEGSADWKGKDVCGTSGDTLSFTADGTHAEYVVVPANALTAKPKNLTFAQAACIGVPFTTAAIMLKRGLVSSNDHVLILGSRGAVGSSAVQLATSMGCKVTTAARGGVDSVIDTAKDFQLRKALDINGGKGPDVILDAVGSEELAQAALSVLGLRGRYVYISASLSTGTISFDWKRLYRKEQMIIGCNSVLYTQSEIAILLSGIITLFEDESIATTPDDKLAQLPLVHALRAYEDVAVKRPGKRVLVMP